MGYALINPTTGSLINKRHVALVREFSYIMVGSLQRACDRQLLSANYNRISSCLCCLFLSPCAFVSPLMFIFLINEHSLNFNKICKFEKSSTVCGDCILHKKILGNTTPESKVLNE